MTELHHLGGVVTIEAVCQRCSLEWAGPNAEKNARAHSRRSLHEVEITTTSRMVWGPSYRQE
jgi:hypothetical protein